MSDIYEILNDADGTLEELKRVDLTDFEKKKIYYNAMWKSSQHRPKRLRGKRRILAVVAALCIMIGIPAAAAVSYFNGNTRNNYTETINETIVNYNPEAAGTNTMEVQKISRVGDDIAITCRFSFDRDISGLKEACADYDSPEGNVLNAIPFKNSTIIVNDWDMKVPEQKDGTYTPFFIQCQNTEINENTLTQKITISIDKDYAKEAKSYEIKLRYKDIVIGEDTIAGEWNYNYTVEEDAYEDEISTAQINISGKDSSGREYTMESYAVTPTGVVVYGTGTNINPKDADPDQSSITRILATDNLGNQYLMYPACPDYAEDAPVLNYVYTLYDGSALLDEPGKYLTEWNPDAATLTLVLQEEVSTWNTASDFAETNYHIYSDEIVINLKK